MDSHFCSQAASPPANCPKKSVLPPHVLDGQQPVPAAGTHPAAGGGAGGGVGVGAVLQFGVEHMEPWQQPVWQLSHQAQLQQEQKHPAPAATLAKLRHAAAAISFVVPTMAA